jgi:hypothetical protein
VSLGLGLRTKEMAGLRWADVYDEEGRVRPVVHLKAAYTKGGCTRDVFVSSSSLRRALERYAEGRWVVGPRAAQAALFPSVPKNAVTIKSGFCSNANQAGCWWMQETVKHRNPREEGSTMSDREHQVRECAYYFWEAEGRPEGRAQMHWAMAEIATTLFSYLNAGAGKHPTPDRALQNVTDASVICQSKAVSVLGD